MCLNDHLLINFPVVLIPLSAPGLGCVCQPVFWVGLPHTT